MRAAGAGERIIAKALGLSHWAIREDRRKRLENVDLLAPPDEGPKVLVYDIENTPLLSYNWGTFDQNAIRVKDDWSLLCFAYKWLGTEDIGFVSVMQDPKWVAFPQTDDRYVIDRIWSLMDTADVVIAHNGDAFDQKKVNARAFAHGLTPTSPYLEVDTLKECRKHFKMTSNRLDSVAQHLGIGGKAPTGGFDLWLGCMSGDPEAWAMMEAYNRQDVVVLEDVFYKISPWMGRNGKAGGFNRGLWAEGETVCPRCGSYNLTPNGFRVTKTGRFQSYLCGDCGARPQDRKRQSQKLTGGTVLT
jgi:hypothetical protein